MKPEVLTDSTSDTNTIAATPDVLTEAERDVDDTDAGCVNPDSCAVLCVMSLSQPSGAGGEGHR